MEIGAVIFAKDLLDMTSFYSALLGVAPSVDGDDQDWTELRAGNTHLWLHRVGAEWSERGTESQPTAPREDAPVKLIFFLEDDGTRDATVRKFGGSVISRPWGNDYCDPEGNVFGVHTEPAK